MDENSRDELQTKLSDIFGARNAQKLLTRLERICYKIAPINPSTGNTQTVKRWELGTDQSHYATQESCDAIFHQLSSDLLGYVSDTDQTHRQPIDGDTLSKEDIEQALASSSRLGSLELPITYRSFENAPIHDVSNIFWFKPPDHRYVLEQWLGDRTIITKIQVKAFLTDRRQTGEYQTNREVRWETHPRSPQFSTRKDCLEIADKLIAQIATFTNAPEPPDDVIAVIEKVLNQPFAKNSFRCPISGKPVLYEDFLTKVTSPVHGRSGYQVGHLNPLASTGGHNADNISWITDLGNRVQGEQSLDDIVKEIFFMAAFHKNRLEVEWSEVEDTFR